MKDPKPLGEWANDYSLHKNLHLSLDELNNMDSERYIFYTHLLREEMEREALQMESENKRLSEQLHSIRSRIH